MNASKTASANDDLPLANAPLPKVAIVHDWLVTWRGGEVALGEIYRIYPGAQLFALVDFLTEDVRRKIQGRHAITSFLQRLPFARRHFRLLLPLFPRAIEALDVSGYDIVISSSHAVAKGVLTHPRQLHVCYCYTPMRYAWDLREQYLSHGGLGAGPRGWFVRRLLDRLRAWDRAASNRVDHFVAISEYIAERIHRAYGRSSTVIYPPVAAATVSGSEMPERGDTYVTVSQLVPYKRIDLIAGAFATLPDRELVIIGDGPERRRLESALPPNVRLLGGLPDDERDRWLATARAFVFAAEEDFGMAPVEAQAHGTPVIAYAKGGAHESIRALDTPRPTGVLFTEQTAAGIAAAIRTFEANAGRISAEACRDNARRFAPERFRRELREFIEARWRERGKQRPPC